ncbi:MAG: hypothetical protein M1824_003846 [Vezdaea acicularis]|nr:MAG: hypothetical protein M1824_003846 [Vezdaea acicularis]
MSPNLFLCACTVLKPHRWFSNSPSHKASPCKEYWSSPVPGLYEYIPGRGWYLVAAEDPAFSPVKKEPVDYCRALQRYVLRAELEERIRWCRVRDTDGRHVEKRLFRMDDGITWICCWQDDGRFVEGPWERWCWDKETEKFRKMNIGGDLDWEKNRIDREKEEDI